MNGVIRGGGEFRRVLITTLATLALWMAAYFATMNMFTEYQEQSLRADAAVRGGALANALDNAMNQRLTLVRGLAAFVTVKAEESPDDYQPELGEEFPVFAKAYSETISGIRNISVTPHFVVEYVYPRDAANLKVLGNNVLADSRPGFVPAVQRAIQSHDIALHEPVTLIQGGIGLIARQAVYVDGYAWGSVALVFEVDPMIQASGLNDFANFDWALVSGRGTPIAGNQGVWLRQPVVTRLSLPEGYWEIALAPAKGWLALVHGGLAIQVVQSVLVAFGLLAIVVSLGIGERLSSTQKELESHARDLTVANQELERFAYVAAHDLQEPLRAIISYSQLVVSTYGRRLDDEGALWLDEVVGSASRMKQLLHDVQLYLAENHLPKPDKPLSAAKALDQARFRLADALERGGATVTAEPLPEVMADQRRLSEIFHVLLSNALEYATPGVAPRVVVRWHSEQGFAVIEVQDNGIGIDPRYHDRIFDVFQRLHTRLAHPGTGMGLAIARKMAERLGGRITVRSALGAGCAFQIHLPLSDAEIP